MRSIRQPSVCRRFITGVGTCLLLSLTQLAFALPMAYTDRSLFNADLAQPGNVVDFDAATAGTAIGNGSQFEGLTFQYDVLAGFGVELQIVDDYDTTSGTNALGTDDGGVFQQGDDLSVVTSGPVNAIGLSLILSDVAFDDEVILSANGFSVGLDAAVSSVLADGGLVYFLGLIDTQNPFSSFSLSTSQCGSACGYFLFNLDDITTAVAQVPEANVLPLGLIALLLLRRRSSKKSI